MTFADVSFRCMGCEVRLVIGPPARPGLPGARAAAADARLRLEEFDAALSRFVPESELCALNGDPRTVVPAGVLLCAAVGAGIWAAERTDGLVDPTLIGALEAAGYRASRAGAPAASLADALAAAPSRRPARRRPAAAWRSIVVDDAAGTITRPPGVRFDTGGTGKGLAADAIAHRLAGYSRFAVDCGGDVRVGGANPAGAPIEIEVAHPVTGGVAHRLALTQGAAATSGIDARLWRRADGRYAHHLLDPSTGEPAWTGIVAATALAPTALEAETLSKAALLSGPAGARRVLEKHGGVLVSEDGAVDLAGSLARAEAA